MIKFRIKSFASSGDNPPPPSMMAWLEATSACPLPHLQTFLWTHQTTDLVRNESQSTQSWVRWLTSTVVFTMLELQGVREWSAAPQARVTAVEMALLTSYKLGSRHKELITLITFLMLTWL